LFQPAEACPDRVVSVCTNEDCRTMAVFDLRLTGNWVVRRRVVAPPMDRRPPEPAVIRARAV
jgi:hypothetical protein